MKTYLSQFETIGATYAEKLRKNMKINTVDEFLRYPIEEIQKKTSIDLDRLQEWLEVFDLFRIPNITPRQAELLRFANINTIDELAHRQTIRIFYKLQEIDEKTYYIILQLPTFAEIDNWVYYAKLMVKRIKVGDNIPIILLPMINFEIAAILKKFNIFTIEDFLNKELLISNLRSKLGLKRSIYKAMKQMITLIEINGIDLLLSKLLLKAGFETKDTLINTSDEEIHSLLKEMAELDTERKVIPSLQEIQAIKKEIRKSNTPIQEEDI